MASIDLSVCIVTYNTYELVEQLLESIYKNTKQISFEVLIADNASSDNIQRVVQKYPNIKFIRNNTNLYFTKADNQNLVRAKGRYIVTLNSDTLVLPGTLEQMTYFLDTHQHVGAITPKFIFPDGKVQPSIGRFPTLKYGIYEAAGINRLWPQNRVNKAIMVDTPLYDSTQPQEGDVLYGACIMARRSVLQTVGFKDEKLVHGWDEYDWCKRISQAGWQMYYVPNAIVVHYRGASKGSGVVNPNLLQYHWDGFFYLYRKYWGIHIFWLLKFLKYLSNLYRS